MVLSGPGAFAGEAYDGDSIEGEGQRARLYGIDAFELSQTCLDARSRPWRCGVAAKAALAERIEGQALECVVLEEDGDGWYIARCMGEDGKDITAYMVRSGLALASTDDYRAVEAEARRRLGGRVHAALAVARGNPLTSSPPGRERARGGGSRPSPARPDEWQGRDASPDPGSRRNLGMRARWKTAGAGGSVLP